MRPKSTRLRSNDELDSRALWPLHIDARQIMHSLSEAAIWDCVVKGDGGASTTVGTAKQDMCSGE